MSDRSDVIYSYDGSFEGLMCCVFVGYSSRELPSDIIVGEPEQITFSEIRYIETAEEQYRRILASLPLKMGLNAENYIKKAFLTCHPKKDLLILKLMYLGYKYGSSIFYRITDEVVSELNKAILHCTREAHLLQGFTRFSDNEGALAAVIEPKNCVIPLIANHFIDRYRNENFLIYDKTHHMALVYASGVPQIMTDIHFELPETSDEELYYQNLWKAFYNSIGIKERFNPRCRMNLMPKRYWSSMVEMQDELNKPQNAPRPSGLSSLSSDTCKIESK
ncbi:MAG: TIGR03915 family putative DNA repair protein [Oscillospiraceae bacterium]|nr:TIGR03915 family putative DNA repair protein [Oscillospiraceae bacterium]